MKKLAIITLWTCALFTSTTFAANVEKVSPISAVVTSSEAVKVVTAEELTNKFDLIIRNNTIESDNEYNSKNYYTSKIKTSELVIPDEIKNNSKKVYFLVEEWYNYPMYKANLMEVSADVWVDEVKKEYNYKVVNFIAGKNEYIFNNKDLVKDFDKNQSKSVNISLVAELNNWEKVYLSNWGYIHIGNKESILNNLKNKEEIDYFGYYNTDDLSSYLEKKSQNLSKDEYKKLLSNSQAKLKKLIKENQASKENLLKWITKESDFEKNVEKFSLNEQTQSLLNSVLTATNSQIQKLRATEFMDWIFQK